MSTEPRRELSSTYFMPDRSNDDERVRVEIQSNLFTQMMGGVLPEQEDPTRFRRVIDIGCGTGGWLIETAKTYPEIELLVGADISIHMIDYARQYAKKEHVDDRVEFQVMDALRMIESPKHYFDLINQRLGLSYLRTWDWPNLLTKYQYSARPGGVIRITEGDVFGETNSPALTEFFDLMRNAFYKAGHMFTPDRAGVTSVVPDLLQRHGFYDIGRRSIQMHFQMGTPEMDVFCEDIKLGFRTGLPLLRKWTRVPDHYDTMCQQALLEMQDPGFTIDWELVTTWGKNPPRQ